MPRYVPDLDSRGRVFAKFNLEDPEALKKALQGATLEDIQTMLENWNWTGWPDQKLLFIEGRDRRWDEEDRLRRGKVYEVTQEEADREEEEGRYVLLASAARPAFASAAAAFAAPDRQAAVLALDPLFKKLPDPILRTIVDRVEPPGPHLRNPDFNDNFLVSLARGEKENRETAEAEEKERQAAEQAREDAQKARRWSFWEKVFFAVVGPLAGGLIAVRLGWLFTEGGAG